MKNIYSVEAGGVRLGTRPDDRRSAVTTCHNLRPGRLESGVRVLRPVGKPIGISTSPMRPLATMSASGHSYLIAAADNKLHVFDTTPVEAVALSDEQGTKQTITLASKELCALANGEQLTVMTETRAYRFHLSDGTLSETDISAMPSISLTAEDMTDISTTVGERHLSQSYPATTHCLNDRDLRAVTDDMRRAYTDICRQAAASGSFVAPMVCRWRVVSRDGECLLESPPLLLGPSDSGRLTAPVTLKSNDRRTVASWEMSLPSWRPAVTLNGEIPDSLSDIVDRIEVVASPVFHPYDSGDMAAATVVTGSPSGDFIRATAAGTWKTLSPDNARQGQARLVQMACRRDALTDVIATLRPHDCTELQITVAPTGVVEQCRRMERLMTSQPATPDPALLRISPPHSFTAGCGATVSGHELWGRLRAHRFGGYPAEVFAASRAGNGAWHAAVSVSFGKGDERVVAISEGLTGAPLTFGPLLSYPSADATSMTITVSAAGTVRTATFPLTPDPTGTHAVYVHPTLQPHSLQGTLPTYVIPTELRKPRPLDSFVCACAVPTVAAPRRPMAIMPVSDGRVSSVWPWGRNNSGWESGSLRFVVMSDAGTHRATLSTLRCKSLLTLTLIDSDAASGDHAVAEADGSLLAVIGRRLVRIGAGGLKTLATDIDAQALAYVGETGELWMASESGVRVVDLKSMTAYSRDAFSLGASAGCYAEVDGRIADLSRESAAAQTYVRWSGTVSTGDEFHRIGEAVLDVRAEEVTSADFALRRMNHDEGENSATCRITAAGRIVAPLRVCCLSLPTRGCSFDFQGRTSADTSITSVKIITL